MKRFTTAACIALGLGTMTMARASAAECGEVTVASMNWQSADVLANLDKFILNTVFGCNATIITGDTVPTITSMAERGSPDIAPEGWVDLIPEVVTRGVEEGRLVAAAKAISDGAIQGWWIPKFIVDANPDIKTIDDVLRHPELFPDPENPGKGAIYNGPQGWGGTVVTGQLFKAYDADKAGFRLIDTGSSAGLDGSIARAYERGVGWVGYYWSPTALLGRYEMVRLDHGVPVDQQEWDRCTTVSDCLDPKKNAWPLDTVQTIVTARFAERADKEIMTYLQTRGWTNETVNALMAWMTDNQATGEDGAKYFLRNNEHIWTEWVSPEAAEKIKAAL